MRDFFLLAIYSQKAILKIKSVRSSFFKVFNSHNSTKFEEKLLDFYTQFLKYSQKYKWMFNFNFFSYLAGS
jgi:hypothetical protein